jgi:hypothetical protein
MCVDESLTARAPSAPRLPPAIRRWRYSSAGRAQGRSGWLRSRARSRTAGVNATSDIGEGPFRAHVVTSYVVTVTANGAPVADVCWRRFSRAAQSETAPRCVLRRVAQVPVREGLRRGLRGCPASKPGSRVGADRSCVGRRGRVQRRWRRGGHLCRARDRPARTSRGQRASRRPRRDRSVARESRQGPAPPAVWRPFVLLRGSGRGTGWREGSSTADQNRRRRAQHQALSGYSHTKPDRRRRSR